jgi:hypothetical protein
MAKLPGELKQGITAMAQKGGTARTKIFGELKLE